MVSTTKKEVLISGVGGGGDGKVSENLPFFLLGVDVRGSKDWQEVLNKADMAWSVSTLPLQTEYGLIETHKAVVREDTKDAIGIVGASYMPLSNHENLRFCDILLPYGLTYVAAGSFSGDSRVWGLMGVHQADFKVAGETHCGYLLFESSHDGSKSTSCRYVDHCVESESLLVLGIKGDKIKHTKKVEERYESAQEMVIGCLDLSSKLKDRLTSLAKKRVSMEKAIEIISRSLGLTSEEVKKRREGSVADVSLTTYETRGQDSGYGVLMSVCSYVDNLRPTRVTEDKSKREEELRALSCVFGSGALLKDKALSEVEVQMKGGKEQADFIPSVKRKKVVVVQERRKVIEGGRDLGEALRASLLRLSQ